MISMITRIRTWALIGLCLAFELAASEAPLVRHPFASLTDLRPAGFSREPSSVAAVEGAPVTLNSLAVGAVPVRYQWFLEGQPIPGKTNSTLSFSRVSRTNEGDYSLVVSNAFGTATSGVARLRVTPPPASLAARLQPGLQPFQLRYRLFVPPAASNSPVERLPLVLSLHGSGERGMDNLSQLRNWPQSLVFVSYTNQTRFPAFFVAPQCPPGWDWNQPDMIEKLFSLLDQLMLEFPVDPDRLYVTGLSMGGFGSWELARQRRPFFAAAIPIAGGGSTLNAADLKDLAIWNFHSATDAIVPVVFSRDMVQAVRDVGGRPIYTEYASGGHEIWAQAWATPGLVEWTFEQRRGQPSRVAPDLQITSLPQNEAVSVVGVDALSVSGFARLLGGPLAQLSWTNVTTTESGFGEGSAAWRLSNLPLIPYLTNDIIFVGATHSFAPALGGMTTVSETRRIVYQPPAHITVVPMGDMLRISWIGGMAPHVLQSASAMDQSGWSSVATNATLPLWLPLPRGNTYFRVISGWASP